MTSDIPAVPRLTYLRIKNYRALRDVEFRDLTPLTVLIGPNGSGKSTVLDALDFLAEAVRGNLVGAWRERNRFAGMQTRGVDEKIEFEVEFFLSPEVPRLHYKIAIQETDGKVYVSDEILTEPGATLERIIDLVDAESVHPAFKDVFRTNIYERDGAPNRYFTNPSSHPIIHFTVAFAEQRSQEAPKTLALGLALASYRHIHFKDDYLKGISDSGPSEELSPNGDNLPNVLYYLHTKHPEILEKITAQMRRWVPNLADVVPEITSDKRLLLRFKDAQFSEVLPAEYMSGGTMRLAALLTLLYESNANGLLGIEEPENELHPQLLHQLGEELIKASEHRQLLVTTHAPTLLNPLEPEQVWILHRGADGYTQATRVADLPGIQTMVEEGSPLGYLWRSNFFEVDNPLTPLQPITRSGDAG